MRLAGTLEEQQVAEKFADYLLTLEIESKLMQEADGWGVWVRDEKYHAEAKEEFAAFIENPNAAVYNSATSKAQSLRKQTQKKNAKAKKLHTSMKEQWSGAAPTHFPLTLLVIGVVILLEAVSAFDLERKKLLLSYLGFREYNLIADFWRPFTTTIIHGAIMGLPFIHALFNMSFFYRFGAYLENWLGAFKFLILILLLAYTSSIISILLGRPGVGFSGVIYGLFGFLLIGRRYRSDLAAACPPNTVQTLKMWFFLCIILSMFGSNIGNIAHGAGWLFGFLYGKAVFTPLNHPKRWLFILIAVLATVIVIVPFYLQLLGFFRVPIIHWRLW